MISEKGPTVTAYVDNETKEKWKKWIENNDYTMSDLIKESVSQYIDLYKFRKSPQEHYTKIKNLLTPIRGYIEKALDICPPEAKDMLNYLNNISNGFKTLFNYLESYYDFLEGGKAPIDCDILYIEDDITTIRMITDHVLGKGYSIKSVNTAEEALDKLSYIHPKLILIDVGLEKSEMQGDELCKQLKTNEKYKEKYKNVTIILITSFIEVEKLKKKTKADGIIKKPFSFKDFDDKISEALVKVKI